MPRDTGRKWTEALRTWITVNLVRRMDFCLAPKPQRAHTSPVHLQNVPKAMNCGPFSFTPLLLLRDKPLLVRKTVHYLQQKYTYFTYIEKSKLITFKKITWAHLLASSHRGLLCTNRLKTEVMFLWNCKYSLACLMTHILFSFSPVNYHNVILKKTIYNRWKRSAWKRKQEARKINLSKLMCLMLLLLLL